MPKDSTGQRTGEPLWTFLIILVIAALVGELWLAGRLARKRFGFREEESPALFAGWLGMLPIPGRKGGV